MTHPTRYFFCGIGGSGMLPPALILLGHGLLTQDDDSAYLTLDALDDNALHHLQSHSVTYRVAVGPQQGKKVFTLQTIPSR